MFLATHFQAISGSDSSLTVSDPLPRFAEHTASVVLEPEADGLVRTMRSTWRIGERVLPSVFSARDHVPAGANVPIGLLDRSRVVRLHLNIHVLGGRIEHPAALHGKSVYVGPTANELRDVLPVPVYRTLPGVVVQAFATASARGILRAPPSWLTAALLLVCAAVSAARGAAAANRLRALSERPLR